MKYVTIMAAALVAVASGSASAAVAVRDVAVENASFEEQALDDGTFFRTSIPGWSATGSGVGYFNPPAGARYNATNGQNVINIDSFRHPGETTDSTYLQLLTETIAAGTVYTMTVDVIRRTDVDIGSWFAEIVSADIGQLVTGATVAQGTLGNADVVPGAFRRLNVTYTGTAADAGKRLGIRFRSVYDPQASDIKQVLLDNVRMTAATEIAATVPEPTTWAMMLLGFGMVGAAVRRRAKVVSVHA